MGELVTYTTFAKRLNAAAWERNEKGDGPINPTECGKKLEFKRPCRALIERPSPAVDVPQSELDLRDSHRELPSVSFFEGTVFKEPEPQRVVTEHIAGTFAASFDLDQSS